MKIRDTHGGLRREEEFYEKNSENVYYSDEPVRRRPNCVQEPPVTKANAESVFEGEYNPEEKEKNTNQKGWFRFFLILIIVTAAVYLLNIFFITAPGVTNRTGDKPISRNGNIFTFVVLGTDDGNGNTDTIMLASFDTETDDLNVISIPRDTLVNVSWNVKKANTLYNYSGIDGVMDGIEDLLGYRPDFYVIVDLEAFEVLVDEIGGVYYNVPVDMDYEDPTQDLYIHINAGEQYLSGEEALKVVRFRSGYSNADIGRIGTQQDFMKIMSKQILENAGTINITTLANVFLKYVETDLTYGNLLWLAGQFFELEYDSVAFHILPGNYGDYVYQDGTAVSYVSIYIDEWISMINSYANPFGTYITEEDLSILTRDGYGALYVTDGVYAGEPYWGS